MKLFIVESPTKVKTIIKHKYLPSDFKVVTSVGHIRELGTYKYWGVDTRDPEYPTSYTVSKDKKMVVNKICELAKEADEIYLATDNDREGEAIAWHLIEVIGKHKFKRLKFNEISKTAIRESLKNPVKIDMNMVDSARARQVIDKLVGYTISPVLNKGLVGYKSVSAGRCQTPALKLSVEKQEEIDKFDPKEYWSIRGDFITNDNEKFEANLQVKDKFFINSKEKSDKVVKSIMEHSENCKIYSVEEKIKSKNPSALYRTTTLQRDASNILKMSSDNCMRGAQKLYELGKITYHRTDSGKISKEFLIKARNYIKEEIGNKYLSPKPLFYKGGKSAQEAHEGIRPTSMDPCIKGLGLDDKTEKLYDMIFKKFVSCQCSQARIQQKSIKIEVGTKKFMFKINGQRTEFNGYLKVWTYGKTSEKEIPDIKKDEKCLLKKVNPEQHFTKPPAQYTNATIIMKLEELGIGRPATYAGIIKTNYSRKYVKSNKRLEPTEKGIKAIEFLRKFYNENILDYQYTSDMEDLLDQVEKGTLEYKTIVNKLYNEVLEKTTGVKKHLESLKEYSDIKCPKCGTEMLIRNGRYGKFLACPKFPKCKCILGLDGKLPKKREAKKTGDKCPECKKGDLVYRTGKSKFIACSNYPKCKFTQGIKKEK